MKHTGYCLAGMLITGGGILKRVSLLVKSSTRRVADIIITLRGDFTFVSFVIFFPWSFWCFCSNHICLLRGTMRDKNPIRISFL